MEIDVRGQKLYVETLGEASGEAILLICGAGAHAHFWTDTFCNPLVEAGYFVIRYDHRDTGLSGESAADYSLDDLAEDAVGVLDAYNISSAHVVGHSMGGYIGQLMAAAHPERLRTLTVISAGPVGATEAITRPFTDEEKLMMHETWRVMLRNRPKETFEESWEGFLGVWERLNGDYPVDEAMARAYTEEMFTRSKYPVGPHERHMGVMQRMAETLEERKEIFSKITLPVLILQGEKDCLVMPQRGGEPLANVLPQAQLEVIPRMGHMLFDQQLQRELAQRLLSFFQR